MHEVSRYAIKGVEGHHPKIEQSDISPREIQAIITTYEQKNPEEERDQG